MNTNESVLWDEVERNHVLIIGYHWFIKTTERSEQLVLNCPKHMTLVLGIV